MEFDRFSFLMRIMLFAIILFLSSHFLLADIPDEITQKLSSDNADIQMDACLMLGRLGQEEAIPLLKERLKHKSMLVRHSAANALCRIGGPSVVDIFKEMVLKGGEESKRVGLAGLAMTGDPESIDLVLAQLDNPSWQVRWSSAYTLGEWGSRAILPRLKELASNDPYKDAVTNEYPVRKMASDACRKIGFSIEWYRTFSDAVVLSKTLERPLCIYWYVKDSLFCRKLEEEVFFSEEIKDISQHFICVKLDAEKDGSQYEIKGAPSIVILDKDGVELDCILGVVSETELKKRLSNILLKKGTPKEWKEQVNNDPSDVETSWYLAEWYLDNNRPHEAVILLENIIKYDPKNKTGYTDNAIFVLGYTFGALKDYNRAVLLLERLRREYGDFKDMDKALYCLGLDYLPLGKKKKTKEIMSSIVRDYPESPVYKKVKEILDRI